MKNKKNFDFNKESNISKKLIQHYDKKFLENGPNSIGVDWGDREKHIIRLKNMIKIISDDINKENILLDVGCGYGELTNILRKDLLKLKSYIGIDPSESMIKFAKDNSGKNVEFCVSSIEGWNSYSDIVFCCGIFTKKLNSRDEEVEDLFKKFLEMCKRVNAKTIVFNTMSSFCDVKDPDLYYPSIKALCDIIFDIFSYRVENFCLTNSHIKYEFIWKFNII